MAKHHSSKDKKHSGEAPFSLPSSKKRDKNRQQEAVVHQEDQQQPPVSPPQDIFTPDRSGVSGIRDRGR